MLSRVRLGHSPLEVTPLGVGCWAWGDREYWRYEEDHGPRDVVAAFDACLEAGLDLFDTAEAYGWGKGEQLLGALARRSPRPVVVATKYAPLAGRGGPPRSPRAWRAACRRLGAAAHRSLPDALGRHARRRRSRPPWTSSPRPCATAAVARGRRQQLPRRARCARRTPRWRRHGVPLATNQVHYSLLHRAPEVDGVLDACRELGVTLLAYSPLEQGLLSGKYRPGVLPAGPRADATWFAADNVAAAQPVIAALRAIAAAHAVDPAAVALAWLLAKPGVVPLAGAKSGEQAARNARALAVQLSDEEMATLDAASAPWRVAQ